MSLTGGLRVATKIIFRGVRRLHRFLTLLSAPETCENLTMRARDLSEDDIGRSFLVQGADGGLAQRRITFEGTPKGPRIPTQSGIENHWMILKCSPRSEGAMFFRAGSGECFAGIIVRSSARVIPLDLDLAVTAEGKIVETGFRLV